ncbi:MAG: hypothetical protein SGJ27_31535 [Candidatus Melainabacteria bacterium]|nr:hypothetical protein [Candidatus Melainabacteria bacterium]
MKLRSWLWIVLLQLPFALVLAFTYQQSESIRAVLLTQSHPVDRIQMLNDAFRRLLVASVVAPLPLSIYLYLIGDQILVAAKKRYALALLQTFLFVGLFYAVVITRFLQYPVGPDDSYIDFQYVQRWLSGRSFDFNPGEKVMGFTSHLHVMVLYSLAQMLRFADIPTLSTVLNASLSCLVIIGLHALCLRLFGNGWQPLLACLIFTLSKYTIGEVSVGKESLIVNFLIVYSLLGLSYYRWSVFCWGSTCLALTRPEGIFWLGAAVVLSYVRRGKAATRSWILPFLPLICVYGFLLIYYGTIIPHGAIGRSTMFQYNIDPGAQTPGYVLSTLGTETFGSGLIATFSMFDSLANVIHPIPQYLLEKAWIALSIQGLIALLALAVLGRNHQALRFYFYCCVLVLLFFTITNPFNFSWYFCWFNMVAPLAVALVMGWLFSLRVKRATPLIRICAVTFCAYLIFHPILWENLILIWFPENDRIICYKKAADFLNSSNAGYTRTLATCEPGAIAYYLIAKTSVIDMGGLQSPECLPFFPVPKTEYSRKYVWMSNPVETILTLKPDCFLSLDIWTDNGVTKNEKFMQDYQIVRFWPCTTWGSRGLFLFIRTDRMPEQSDENSPGSTI